MPRVGAYSRQQQATIAELLAAAQQLHASPMAAKALLEAGKVESNFTPLTGGDRDSTGVLQQRPSQGWGPVGESVQTDARQFLAAAQKLQAQGFKGSAGALAQAVQRSAFPARYDQVAGDVAPLLGGAGAAGMTGAPADAGATPSVGPDGTAAASALLAGLQQPKPAATVAGLQAPSFAAHAAVPGGSYTAPAGGAPQQGASGVQALLAAAAASQGGDVPSSAGAPSMPAAGQAGGGPVEVAQGAERAGQGLQKPLLGFLHELAQASGQPVKVTTGTNHNQYVAGEPGVQSDHWDGNAADLGLGGDARQDKQVAQRGDAIAAHAIALAGGVPYSQALEMARKGGVFNFQTKAGRVQVLWKTMTGGNHYNHVHIGLSPGR